jgi:predicted transcriptional regulator
MMGDKSTAGWHRYDSATELVAELELTDEEMDRARILTDTYVRAWHLTQVRKAQDRTQADLAQAMGVTQPRVSEIENGDLDRVTVSTLRAYVRALGGTVRIVADFGDREYRLT